VGREGPEGSGDRGWEGKVSKGGGGMALFNLQFEGRGRSQNGSSPRGGRHKGLEGNNSRGEFNLRERTWERIKKQVLSKKKGSSRFRGGPP